MKRLLSLLLVLSLLLLLPVGAAAALEPTWEAVLCKGAELGEVRSIVPTESGLWVCAGDGLYFVDAEGQARRVFETQAARGVVPDTAGGFWAVLDTGVLRLDADGRQLAALTAESSKLPDNDVWAVALDSRSRVWFGTAAGLARYNPTSDSWTVFDASELAATAVSALCADGTGGMWIGHYPDGQPGSFTGGYSHITASGDVTVWRFDAESDTALNGALPGDFRVRSLAPDGAGGIYAIRAGAEPAHFERESYPGADGKPIPLAACVGGRLDHVGADGAAVRYTGRALSPVIDGGIGLESTPELRTALLGKDGRLWLGTSGSGLLVADSVSDSYRQYASANTSAFLHTGFDNINALALLADGAVCVGSEGGLRVLRAAPEPLSLGLSNHRVQVDGAAITPEAYNIGGNNYFKLRDLALCLSGTEKQFSVDWDDGQRAIVIQTGAPYVRRGGELVMSLPDSSLLDAAPSTHRLIIDGVAVTATAYTINGNNYFMLRDLGRLLNFYTGWDPELRLVSIITPLSYEA